VGPGDRRDLRQRWHPPRPHGHRLPGEAPPAGAAVRRPAQPARQLGGTHLGRAEELRGQHRRQLARPAPAGPFLLPCPLTGSDAGYHRALDHPMAASGLRAELLECRSCDPTCGPKECRARLPGATAGPRCGFEVHPPPTSSITLPR
jgi:hypothetical protein